MLGDLLAANNVPLQGKRVLEVSTLQGYLAYKKPPPRRTLP